MSSVITSLAVILICLLTWWISKSNLAKDSRYKQIMMPFVAVIFSVVLLVLFSRINSALAMLYGLACNYINDLSTVDFAIVRLFVFNVAALILFKLVKFIVLRIAKHLKFDPDSPLAFLYKQAYLYDKEESHWFLRNRYSEIRKAAKWMFITALVVSVVLMVLSIVFAGVGAFTNLVYPVFVVMLVGEVFYYLDGMTKTEYLDDLHAEDDDADRIRDYLKLQQIAAMRFPDRLVEAHISHAKQDVVVSGMDMLQPYLDSDDYEEKLAGTFAKAVFETLDQFMADSGESAKNDLFKGLDFDESSKITVDQINTMVLLLKGRNVIFASPFFRDYREFVFFPINRRLLQGKRVLVIDGQGCERDSITAWLSEGLQFASSIPNLWSIEYLDGQLVSPLPNVGIIPYPVLNDFEFQDKISGFLREVGFVILLNPANILAVTQIGFAHLTYRMPGDDQVTYVAFDVNADGLVDSLSHAVRAEFVEVAATGNASLINCGMMWTADGPDLHTRVFDNVSQYLGAGTEIAAFSLGLGVESVTWSSSETVPLKDARWLSGQYYQAISKCAELPKAQHSLDEAIEFNPDLWNVSRRENGYFIVEDEYANALEMQRQYSTRGIKSSFINVISGSYLLRDFLRYNEHLLSYDPKVVPLIAPDFQRSERNYMIELANQLVLGWVDLSEIVARLRLLSINCDADSATSYVYHKMDEYGVFGSTAGEDKKFKASNLIVRVKNEMVFKTDEMDYVRHDYLHIPKESNGDPRRDVLKRLEYLKNAHYIAEDEVETARHLGSCLYGQIQQKFLPGQFVTIAGKYYEVLSVTPDSGMLMRRAADHFDMRLNYRQVKVITLSSFAELPVRERTLEYGNSSISIETIPATVNVETLGYLRMADYADLQHAAYVDLGSMGEKVDTRRYSAKSVLRIGIRGATDKQLITLSVLLNEMFRTLYARGYEYLTVAPRLSKEATFNPATGPLRGVIQELVDEDSGAGACLYVIEDSMVDIGLVSSVERNIEQIFSRVRTYMIWHQHMLEEGPVLDPKRNFYSSLEELLGTTTPLDNPPGSDDEGFGADDEPPQIPQGTVECDFCGRIVPKESVTTLKDGRDRCPTCSQSVLKDRAELDVLFQGTMKQMQEFFGISFENPISVKMVSQRRMSRKFGKKFIPTSRYDPRVAGFVIAKRGKQVMWLENGYPRIGLTSTIAHELTHVWQNQVEYYTQHQEHDAERIEMLEGMAVWTQVQFLILAGAKEDALAERYSYLRRDDEYGRGYRRFLKAYPHAMTQSELKDTPFKHPEDPLGQAGKPSEDKPGKDQPGSKAPTDMPDVSIDDTDGVRGE